MAAVAVAARTGLAKCLCGTSNRLVKCFNQTLKQPETLQRLHLPSYFKSYSTSAEKISNDDLKLFEQVTVKVRGSDEAVLDSYTQFVQRAANALSLEISGKIILPMHAEKRTLLKSPHVYKTSRVQYELRTHARMLQLRQLTEDTADIFLEYVQRNIPEGVSMSIEQTELEYVPEFLKCPEQND